MLTRRTGNALILAAIAGFALPAASLAQCPPNAPQGVSASDGTICNGVFIDWLNVSGANSYFVYRNTANNYANSSLVGQSFDSEMTDVTASVGTTYFYWVVATRTLCLPGSGNSNASAAATGYRAGGPSNPENVSASDGLYCGGVHVQWTQAEPQGRAVQTFRIYRNTINLYATSDEVGAVGGGRRWFFDASATPGDTYFYWVRAENQCGNNASSGDSGYRSTVAGPANDFCASATVVSAGNSYVGSTNCASSEGPEACNSGEFSPDVWYRYNATSSGTLQVGTCGSTSSFDTVLSVFVQDCAPSTVANMVACNDDDCAEFLSSVNTPVVAGNAYYIRVAGFLGDSGNFALNVGFTPAGGTPCYANCDSSTASPVLNVADFTCFLQRFAAGQPYANCDNSTTAPTLNVADFTCFLQGFAAGCP